VIFVIFDGVLAKRILKYLFQANPPIPPKLEYSRQINGIGEHKFQIYYCDTFLFAGSSKLNECVRKITDGMAPHPWAGPILVLKTQK